MEGGDIVEEGPPKQVLLDPLEARTRDFSEHDAAEARGR